MEQIQPDSETTSRIKNLGIVGKALSEETNDNQGPTNVFLAKTALQEFKEGIEKLNLDPQSAEGIKFLVGYLSKQLDKKMTELA